MVEKVAFSLALDLLFNGQDMDYCERPIDLSAFETMAMFDYFPENAPVAVVGPGGGRLVKSLLEYGCIVDAYEGREECANHLREHFKNNDAVRVLSPRRLNDPLRRDKMLYEGLFCMDDLRAFRENHEWTDNVQRIVRPGGYFVYSQVSNLLPTRKRTLDNHFKLVGDYNVSEATAKMIRDSYFSLSDWEPRSNETKMVKETLAMVESASNLRRNIKSGVEVRYLVWRRKEN